MRGDQDFRCFDVLGDQDGEVLDVRGIVPLFFSIAQILYTIWDQNVQV